jgi:hypothetical protein
MTQAEINAAISEATGESKLVGLVKGSLWYRPYGHGYTGRSSEAWRLTLEEAKKHEYLQGASDEWVQIVNFNPRDFYGDLNACHEAEDKLEFDHYPRRERYHEYLHQMILKEGIERPLISATAPQRCAAILRTIGKWKE